MPWAFGAPEGSNPRLSPSYSCLAGMESGAGREDVFGNGGKAPDALSTDSKTQKRGS